MQAPTTIDEWYTVMKAFKENDPNGNGKRDEIPMNINLNQIRTGNAEDTLVGAWGIGFDFYQEDGKVKYGMLDPKFKEFIATLQKWYKEGLLDQEYATTDTKLFDAKMTGDRIGSSVFLAGGGIGKYNQLMETKNPNFKLAGTAYPTLKKVMCLSSVTKLIILPEWVTLFPSRIKIRSKPSNGLIISMDLKVICSSTLV